MPTLSLHIMMEFGVNLTLMAVLFASLATYLVIAQIISPKYDKTEPPLIPSKIPIFGHLIGLVRKGQSYYTQLR